MSTLSLSKIEKFLYKKFFTIDKIFVLDDLVRYIEISSFQTIISSILYIPSKYDISPDKKFRKFIIKEIDIKDDAYNTTTDDISKTYSNINVNKCIDVDDDIETNLLQNYDKPIDISNIKKSSNSSLNLNSILSRLQFSTKNLEYKLCIVKDNYMSVVKRDDSIINFVIRQENVYDKKIKLFITVDLELVLKESTKKIIASLIEIKDEVLNIIIANQKSNSLIMKDMLVHLNDSLVISSDICSKQDSMKNYSEKLKKMFDENQILEKSIDDKLNEVKNEYKDKHGMHYDIELSHRTNKLEKELEQINKIRQIIVSNIQEIQNNSENLLISCDSFIFDNIIMSKRIISNIKNLQT